MSEELFPACADFLSSCYKGIGTGAVTPGQLVSFLDSCFGFSDSRNGFLELAPKLYRESRHPEQFNYIIQNDRGLLAAVGAYPVCLQVSGTPLSVLSIGNVAVDPAYRMHGLMDQCMKLALEESQKKHSFDFAVLNGQRQRYARFGFEPAGICGKFTLTEKNLKAAAFLAPGVPGYTVAAVPADDRESLALITSLYHRQPSFMERPEEKRYDIFTAWNGKLYRVNAPDGSFAGYFIYNGPYYDAVTEIHCIRKEAAAAVCAASFRALGKSSLDYYVPEYDTELFYVLSETAGSCTLTTSNNFCIFHFDKVLSACLRQKSGFSSLCDGELRLEIRMQNGTKQRLRLRVQNHVPSVEAWDSGIGLQLEYPQAVNALFGLISRERAAMPAFVQSWFPLPLYIPFADND